MHNTEDEKLIANIIERICTQQQQSALSPKPGATKLSEEQLSQSSIRERSKETLVILSDTKFELVLQGLVDKLSQPGLTEEDQLTLLDLLVKCLSIPWNLIKKKFQVLQNDLPADQQPSVDVKISDALATKALDLIMGYLTKSPAGKSTDEVSPFQAKAGNILFYLSAFNDAPYNKVISIIQSGINEKDNEETANLYGAMEYINVNSKRLSNIFHKVHQITSQYAKKGSHQIFLARVLRKTIWSWIDNYPKEFVQLYRSGNRLDGNPDTLFDVFNDWSSNSSKAKNTMWPLQTMLLVCCPDALSKISQNKADDNPGKFLDTLKKAFKSGKLADIAAICFVDISKSATFLPAMEPSPLRALGPALQNELDEKLFDPKTPFKNSDGDIDVKLMTESLVSSFRLSPNKVLNTLLPDFLKPDAPYHFKIALVNAFVRITIEGSINPWSPTLTEVYSSVSAKMRNLFSETVHSASQILAGDQSKRTKVQQEKLTADLQILEKLITLFQTDPKLPLYPTGIIAQDVDATKNFLLGIVECINKFSVPEISDAASITLLEFHKPMYIEKWVPKSVVASFWEISSCVNIALANILIDGKELKPASILKVITLLEEILSRRNTFLRSQQNEDVTKLQELRMQSTTKLEITVLINLCNGDTEICTKAATCLGLLCDEIDIVGSENASVISTNYQVYRRIAASGVLTTGRVAQQLGIRKLLRRVDRPTAGNFAAWQEVYERWDVYTQVVKTFTEETVNDSTGNLKKGKSGKDLVLPKVLENKLPMEIQQEWHNITGFLLALSGVALNRELTTKPVKLSTSSPATSADPKKFKLTGSNTALSGSSSMSTSKSIDSFMDEISDLMLFDTKNVRESIMSLTGNSLSPTVYPILTRNLIQTTQKFFGTAGQINTTPKSTLFVDQSVSLVKHIIELQQESDNLSLLSDLEILLESLAKYISQLEVEETTLKIRKTFCTLLDSIMQRKQSISFRNELKFRNILIDVILGWTSDFAEKKFEENGTGSSSSVTSQTSGGSSLATGLINAPRTLVRTASSAVNPTTPAPQVDMGKLFKELDVEAMKAMASLLRGLPLNVGEGNDPQAIERKKQRFVKYFSYFTKLLTRCKEESRGVAKKPTEKKSALADFTISCLSNLLAANIDSGLQYFVTMGYHEDFETRTAFLKVISNILKQGTEFDQTGEESEKYEKLIELLMEPDQSVVLALCEATQITEADDVASLLIRLFESYEKTMPLLKASIEYEINKTEQSTTLFRRNSMTTKLLAAYSKVMGRDFLKDVLHPFIHSWLQNPVTTEINPERMPKGENLETNINNLTRLCQHLLNSFQSFVEKCPQQIREVCKMLKDGTHERFPGLENSAVGSFIFLRYICPAIVSPEGFGIVNDLRRSLLLVSKCINNLASGVTFEEDKKEPYMTVMNPFITSNLPVMAKLLDQFATLSNSNTNGNTVSLFNVNEEQKESDLAALHHFMVMYLEKVTRNLQQIDQQKKTNTFDRLTTILQKLGAPPEITHNKPSVRATMVGGSKADNSLYDNFMRNMASKNTDKIKELGIYYKQGTSKEKHPVFYLIARKFNSDMDMELLLYYILKTTQAAFSKPYVLVIDATLFTLDNGLSPSWCAYFIKHFPVVAADNLHQLIIVNPSHELKKYSKRISKFIGRASKKIIFLTNATKLNEYISDSEIGLPADTLAIEKDVKHSFTPVIKVSRQQFFQKEIVLRISGDYLQLLWVKPAPVFGVNTQLMDIFFLPTIEQIETSGEEYEFSIKYRTSSGSKSITLRSPSCKAIIQAINGARNIHKLTTDKFSGHKLRNPSDVPGTLLNMALINLGSGNEQLRVAAYNMLNALSTTFQFSIRLHEAEGLCIPSNSFSFIVDLSEQLAATQLNLTLEFLLECLQGLSTSKPPPALKHLVLDYMRPWLPNLKKFYRLSGDADSSEKVAKTKDVINSLIDFTISESSIQTLILVIVWETIGNVPDLIGTVLECCIEKAFKSGFGSSQLEVICSIVNSLASKNSKIVSGKLIHRILSMIQQTNSTRVDDDTLWPNISIMLRIIFALSFYNHLHVQQYLPELFHLVLMLFCNGTSDIRATLYGILINIVHSLYSVIPDEKYQGLRFHLSELSQPQVKLHFGIGGQSVSAYSKPDASEKKLDKVSMNAVEAVTNVLYSILSSVSIESHVIESTWHARWRSLITQAAFTPNPSLQPRACVALGVICKSRSLVTDDLLELVLESLRSALRETMNGTDHDMSVALLMCLSHLYEYLPASSPYFKTIFWVAMAIIQISDEKLFSAALSLIQVILKIQDNEGFERGLEETYMEVRDGPVDQILTKLEQLTGISFKSSFSFAVAGNLLKGLKYSKAKENTSRVLTSLLDISAKSHVGGNILGYLAALLPVEGEIPILRDLPIGGTGKDLYQYFFTTQLLPDVKHGALLFTFLITILQSTEKEHEQEFIYYALKEGVSFMPEAFCVIEDILVPMMSEVILKSQNESLIESVHSITQSLYTFKQNVNSNKLTRSYLNEIGYHKLPNCASFDIEPEIKREITKIVILLLDNLLKEVRSKK